MLRSAETQAVDLCQIPARANRINWRKPAIWTDMRSKRLIRRIFGALFVIAGALLMWLSPETRAGASLLLIGVAIELVGLALERPAHDDGKGRRAVDR
jgi:hypothetical protein